MRFWLVLAGALLVVGALLGFARGQTTDSLRGSAVEHTAQSAKNVVEQAQLALPPAMTGGRAFFGKWKEQPHVVQPGSVVLFLHGSSGLSLAAIEEWQKWLSSLGIASVAPDSFALPERLTYTSPIDKAIYERIHALRASEIVLALGALRQAGWADPARIVLAGTSEGATAVARNDDANFAARMIFSWSCEDNYFVQQHATRVIADQPVLNVISATDPFFSPANAWLGSPTARGHCAAALAAAKRALIVLVPGAPHTLINLPYVRALTRGFLERALSKSPS
jgi:hypothetical protein